ncbi:MAG TPA: DnaJ domain-containing protein [Fimbriimonadaceae bacterium]|nr:DnaJ domain-containing protein [Fimbriimonadaceae bacterium]HRJ32632.1 DnaJ domain-containing protein [Fimbriimonadaceae bacterium]
MAKISAGPTHYVVLGVDPQSKPAELRAAYRRLARKYHPDVNPDPKAHELMARINTAFESLIDPVRRMEYDASLNGGAVADPNGESQRAPEQVQVTIAHRIVEHRTPIYALTFRRETGELISASFDNEILWWNPSNGQANRRIKLEGGAITNIQSVAGDKLVASGCSETSVAVWRTQGESLLGSKQFSLEWAVSARVSPDGARVAAGSVNRAFTVSQTETGEKLFAGHSHSESVTALAWSPDGRYLATGSADASVKLWDGQSGRELFTFQYIRSTVTALAFSPDGSQLAVGAVDLSIRIFDVAKRQHTKTFFGHERPIESLAFHPCGWLLGSAGRDGFVGLFDTYRGIGHGKIEASHLPLSTIAFSPNGDHMAAGGLDKVLRIWNLRLAASKVA